MDASRQDTSTGNSMYLSFDAESTISSVAFKTLEASTMSALELECAGLTPKRTEDSHANSTLEAINLSQQPNIVHEPKKSNKKNVALSIPSSVAAPSSTPLCTGYRKNALQQYKALYSTPSKEQLLRNVEIARGSGVDIGPLDLATAFSDLDTCLTLPPQHTEENRENPQSLGEENKENTHPTSEESSSLSISSSVEIVTTVIERKMMALSTTKEEKSLEELEEGNQGKNEMLEEPVNNSQVKESKDEKVIEIREKPQEKDTKSTEAASANRRSILAPKDLRKFICEPDLKANRPSRILNRNSKQLPTVPTIKMTTENEPAADIQKLLTKMLKISEVENKQEKCLTVDDTQQYLAKLEVKGHTTKIPASNQGEKRPFNYAQRMSVVVKTTLNSPARKIARRSVLPSIPQTRKSIMFNKAEALSNRLSGAVAKTTGRKSMLPIGTKTTKITETTAATAHNIPTQNEFKSKLPASRKSLHPQIKTQTADLSADTQKSVAVTAQKGARPKSSVEAKPHATNFICSVCGSKFSIKSLLNAHMRSHEDGVPSFIKKSTTVSATPTNSATNAFVASSSHQPLLGSTNKCKYCDKKFALLRALHIHLLQHCPKIPPNEKRKLEYTELNHVEKAQLPALFHSNNGSTNSQSQLGSQSNLFAAASNTSDSFAASSSVLPSKSHSSSAPLSSTESLTEKKDIRVLANELVAAVDGVLTKMAPPSSILRGKKQKPSSAAPAHSGVYRTPSKSIPCHLCKKNFKSVLEFTNHSMTMHSSIGNSSAGEANSGDVCRNISPNSPTDFSAL